MGAKYRERLWNSLSEDDKKKIDFPTFSSALDDSAYRREVYQYLQDTHDLGDYGYYESQVISGEDTKLQTQQIQVPLQQPQPFTAPPTQNRSAIADEIAKRDSDALRSLAQTNAAIANAFVPKKQESEHKDIEAKQLSDAVQSIRALELNQDDFAPVISEIETLEKNVEQNQAWKKYQEELKAYGASPSEVAGLRLKALESHPGIERAQKDIERLNKLQAKHKQLFETDKLAREILEKTPDEIVQKSFRVYEAQKLQSYADKAIADIDKTLGSAQYDWGYRKEDEGKSAEERTKAVQSRKDLIAAKSYLQQIKDAGGGFVEGIRDNWQSVIPYLREINLVAETWKIGDIAKKKERTASEQALLDAYMAVKQFEGLVERSAGYNIGAGVANLVGYGGAFALSGPLGASVRDAARKMVVRWAPRAVIEASVKGGALKQAAGKIVTRAIPSIAGGTVQSLTNVPGIISSAQERMIERYNLSLSPEGKMLERKLDENGKADGVIEAYLSSIGMNASEYVTESWGVLAEEPMRLIKRVMLGSWMEKRAIGSMAKAYDEIKKKIGYNQIAGEVFEEMANAPLSAAADKRSWKPLVPFTEDSGYMTPEQIAETAAVVAFPGAVGTVARFSDLLRRQQPQYKSAQQSQPKGVEEALQTPPPLDVNAQPEGEAAQPGEGALQSDAKTPQPEVGMESPQISIPSRDVNDERPFHVVAWEFADKWNEAVSAHLRPLEEQLALLKEEAKGKRGGELRLLKSEQKRIKAQIKSVGDAFNKARFNVFVKESDQILAEARRRDIRFDDKEEEQDFVQFVQERIDLTNPITYERNWNKKFSDLFDDAVADWKSKTGASKERKEKNAEAVSGDKAKTPKRGETNRGSKNVRSEDLDQQREGQGGAEQESERPAEKVKSPLITTKSDDAAESATTEVSDDAKATPSTPLADASATSRKYGGIAVGSVIAYRKAMDKAKAGNAADLVGLLHTGNKNLRRLFTDETGVKLPKTEGGSRAAIRAWAETQREAQAESSQLPKLPPPAPPAGGKSLKEKAAVTSAEIDNLWADFNKSLGQLQFGLSPEQLAIGVKLVAKYTELGVYKFADIAEDAYKRFGEKAKQLLEALKAAYASYAATAPGSVADKLSELKEVRAFSFGQRTTELIEEEQITHEPTFKEVEEDATKLAKPSRKALAGISAPKIQVSDKEREAEAGTGASGEADAVRDAGTRSSGGDVSGGVGTSEGKVSVSTRGAGRGTADNSSLRSTEGAFQNYRITETDRLGEGGISTKFNDNLAAIRLLKQLEKESRNPTREEQAILVKYVGWGGIKSVFPDAHGKHAKGWGDRHAQLKELLTDEEYAAARRSVLDSHYTSEAVVSAMWAIAQRLGFNGGLVLEPTVGIGNFIGLVPQDIAASTKFTGVELDPITAAIAKHLYPESNIIGSKGFQDVPFEDDYFYLAIGNPPFGDQPLPYGQSKHLKGFSIHNAIIAREVDKVAPGGIVINVITKSFLDKAGEKQRQYIAHRTKFIGAIRLPNSAFQENANTEVTTDIVILQKLPKEEWGKSDQSWTTTTTISDPLGGEAIPINTYFADNPDMMLGTMQRSGKMYRAGEATLVPFKDRDIRELLNEAIQKLPQNIIPHFSTTNLSDKAVEAQGDGGYFITDGKVYQKLSAPDGTVQTIEITPDTVWSEKQLWGKIRVERLKGAIRIRDAVRKQLKLEYDDAPTEEIEKSRKLLNAIYDDFVNRFGFLSSRSNQQVFADDQDAPLLLSLEGRYDAGVSAQRARALGAPERKPTAVKSMIFSTRVLTPYAQPTFADSAQDALFISLAEKGRVDIDYMAGLTRKSESEIIKDLSEREKPLIFKNPLGGWEYAEHYLSGNVKKKYNEAMEAGLEKNAEALLAVFPKDVPAGEIRARLGVPWISEKDYESFAAYILGEGTQASIKLLPTGGFSVNIVAGSDTRNKYEYGTQAMPAERILSLTLNSKDIVIRDRDGAIDREATEEARQKQSLIRQEFDEWIFKDRERRQRLVKYYNDNINVSVKPKFDGGHLTFPGKAHDIKMRNHQENAVWRIIVLGKALLDHVVGSGKTYTMIAAAMELKRLGLARKPMVVVPNHLVEQWSADFLRLYPGAKILSMTRKDFSAQNRKHLLARIATNQWDAVIIGHSSFGFIGTGKEQEIRFIEEQVRSIQGSIDIIREQEGRQARRVRDMERSREKMLAKLKELTDKPKDDFLTFDELGVDYLFVDESHSFKNLFFSTSRQMLGLGNPQGSKKAMDMFIKTRWLQEKNGGKGVVFATGTPISNSLTELYTLQRYLGMDELTRINIKSFDQWFAMFGDELPDYELDGTGVRYKSVTRLRAIVNLPEMMAQYQQFADSVPISEAKRMYNEQYGKKFPIPKVKGGKPENVVVPRSREQSEYMESIVDRAQNLTFGGKDNMLVITMDARKAALDMRLINPHYVDREGGKVDEAADRIMGIYTKWEEQKGTQLVFLDLSVPMRAAAKESARIRKLIQDAESGSEEAQEKLAAITPDQIASAQVALNGFSVYDDLKAKLIRRGVKEKEIAFIHDYDTDEKKADLFEQVNAGKIRVLLGSTEKMGAGMNVQKRLVALHHLDCPWRPSDIEQREGRIIRQGNLLYEADPENFAVEILRYSTELTYDARMWQVQEQKLRGIEGIRSFAGEREMEEVAAAAASAAEMKAAASGNPLILEDVQLAEQIRRLEMLKRTHSKNQYELEDTLKRYEMQIRELPSLIERIRDDVKLSNAYNETPYGDNPPTGTVEGKTVSSAKEALELAFESIRRQKAEQGIVETNQDDSDDGEQKGGHKRPKYSVEVNGVKITSEAALFAAVHEHWGDRTPFAMTIDGKRYISLREAAAAIMERARDFGRRLNSSPPELSIGEIGGFNVTLTYSPQWSGTMIVNLLRGDRRYDSSPVVYDPDKSSEIGLRVVNKAVSLITAAIPSNLRYAEASLEQAGREIDDVRANVGKPWGKEAELEQKKAHHAEVRRMLASEGTPLASFDPRRVAVRLNGKVFVGNPGEIHADLLKQMSPQEQFDYLDGRGEDGYADNSGQFLTRSEAISYRLAERKSTVEEELEPVMSQLSPSVRGDIIIVTSSSPVLPEAIRAMSRRAIAAFYNGKIYIFSDKKVSPHELQKVLIEELVHYAIAVNPSNVFDQMFGVDNETFLDKVWADYESEIKKQEWYARYSSTPGYNPDSTNGRRSLANEYVAKLVENPYENIPLYRRLLVWVRGQLRKLFPHLKYSNAELAVFVRRAFKGMADNPTTPANTKVPLFLYAGKSATGFATAKKFTGKFDKKKRFEIDDSKAKVNGTEVSAYHMADSKQPMFRSAAIRVDDGTIYEGKSHPDAMEQLLSDEYYGMTENEQQNYLDAMLDRVTAGFMTGEGKFVTRDEAVEMIREASVGSPNREQILDKSANADSYDLREVGALANQQSDDDILARLKPIIEATGGYNVKVRTWMGRPVVYFEHKDVTAGGRHVPTTFVRFPEAVDTPEKIRSVVNEKRSEYGEPPLAHLQDDAPVITGIKNAVTLEERRARDRREVEVLTRRTFGDAFERGKGLVDSGEIDPRILAMTLSDTPRALSAEESVVLIYDRMRLRNEHQRLVDRLSDNMTDEERANLRTEMRHLEELINTNDEAARRTGYEQGLGLAARKLMISQDYSLVEILRRATQLNNGKELTEQERLRFEQLEKELAEANRKLEEQEKKLKDQKILEAIREQLEKELAEAKGARKKKTIKPADDLKRKIIEARGGDISRDDLDALIKAITKEKVAAGEDDVDKLVLDVQYEISSFVKITEREVRDIISDYGKTVEMSKDESDVRLRELRRQARLISAIEDAKSGQRPLRSGLQRDASTQRVRELTRELNEALRRSGIPKISLDPEHQMKSALDAIKTRLRHEIEDLTKMIDTGVVNRPQRRRVEYDEEAMALKERRDSLKELVDQIDGGEQDYERLLRQAIQAAQRAIDDYEKRIASGNLSPKKKIQSVWSVELGKLKERQELLRRQVAAARAALMTPEQQLMNRKEAIRRQIAALEQKISQGDFTKKKRRRPIPDRETLSLRAEVKRLRQTIDSKIADIERRNRSFDETLRAELVDALNVPRAVMAAFDMSMPFRQAVIQTASHPIIAAKAFGSMHRAFFSEKAFREVDAEIESRHNWVLYRQFGLDILNPDERGPLSAREESFASHIAERLWIIGRGVRMSERAAYTYTNKIRADIFDLYAEELDKAGYSPVTNPEAYDALAKWINVTTGRGSYGRMTQYAPLASAVLFSPRLLKARLDVIANVSMYKKMPKELRILAMKDILKFVGAGIALLTLAAASGLGEVELDPRSVDFGKIRVGNTRIDPWGGFSQIIRFFAQFISAQRKTGKGQLVNMDNKTPTSGNRLSLALRFGESKLNPQTGLLVEWLRGSDYLGNKFEWGDALVQRAVPLYLQDAYDATRQMGWRGALVTLPGFYGVGTMSYDGAESQRKMAKKYAKDLIRKEIMRSE
jgi:N12 class adenine-specific DNA methylase